MIERQLTAQRRLPVFEITADTIEGTPSLHWTAHTIDVWVRANELLACVSEIAAKAARLVHGEERSIKDAAKLLDRSRFAVARLLQQVSHRAQRRWMTEKCRTDLY